MSKKPTDDDLDPPPKPAKRMPTIDELRERGWKTPEPSGKGFVLPLHGPVSKKKAPE